MSFRKICDVSTARDRVTQVHVGRTLSVSKLKCECMPFGVAEYQVQICALVGYYAAYSGTVIPRLTKIIRSGITFVSRNVISRRFI